jgi:type II secretory pathway component PulJ
MSRHQSRGYTLVEAIVVVALVVVVLGMALDALIETNRAAQVVSDQLLCAREAQTIAQRVEKYLRSALAQGADVAEYKANRLKFFAVKVGAPIDKITHEAEAGTALELKPEAVRVTIENDLERRRVLAEEASLNGPAKRNILGNNADAYCAEVAFAYAESVDNFAPNWKDELSTTPLLTKITVRVWPRVAGFNSFEDARKAREPRYAEIDYWVRVR